MLAFRLALALNFEFGKNENEKLAGIHPRIEQKCSARTLIVEPIQQPIDERGLARTDFTSQRDEAFAGLDAVHKASQGLLDLLGQIEIAGIRVNVERIFLEFEEALVHEYRPWLEPVPEAFLE